MSDLNNNNTNTKENYEILLKNQEIMINMNRKQTELLNIMNNIKNNNIPNDKLNEEFVKIFYLTESIENDAKLGRDNIIKLKN